MRIFIGATSLSRASRPRLPGPRLLVGFPPQIPSCAQSPSEHIFTRLGEPDMSCAHPAPSTFDWDEDIRHFGNKIRLLLRSQHEVAVAVFLSGERGEDPATHTKIRRAHMRAFLSAFQAECDASKIRHSHAQRLHPCTVALRSGLRGLAGSRHRRQQRVEEQ